MDASQDAAAAVHVVVHPLVVSESLGRRADAREVVGMDSLPSSVRAAREVIRRVLDSLDPEWAERAAVCGSELVANAVRHGARRSCCPWCAGPRTSSSPWRTAAGNRRDRVPHWTTTHRPGTLIIDRLADRWGVDFLPGGKQVWCRISLGAEDRMVRA